MSRTIQVVAPTGNWATLVVAFINRKTVPGATHATPSVTCALQMMVPVLVAIHITNVGQDSAASAPVVRRSANGPASIQIAIAVKIRIQIHAQVWSLR